MLILALSAAAAPAAMSSSAPLPAEMYLSAQRGELQNVAKWLRKGGLADALCPVPNFHGQTETAGLLHTAATHGHLEIVRELLKRGASVDLQSGHGATPLMNAALRGHLSVLLVLLQHSANPDLQANNGATALMVAAEQGQEAGVLALLRAKADTELLDNDGNTALQWAMTKGHTATAELFRQHASCLSLLLDVALSAVVPLAWPWVVSVMLGVVATIAFSRILRAGPGQHRAARQRRPHRSSRHAKAHGRTTTADATRQHAALPQPAAAVAPHAMQAAQAARADAAMEELLAEMSSKPAASAAARAEAALRGATAGGGLSALEAALAAAPREVQKGGVGVEARARCDRLLEVQQEAEREAKQEAAAEAASLAAAERAQESTAREAVWAAAVFKVREASEEAAAIAAVAAAAAKADALERATADAGEGGSGRAAGPPEASEAAEVPDEYVCPITAEIMTDPVSTLDGFTYERGAITEWLRTKDTSPSTGAKLESKTLIPNLSLRSMIRSFSEASTAR